MVHDGRPAPTARAEDHDKAADEDGQTSDGIEGLLLTQQTPKMLSDRENVTPKGDTIASHTETSTPEVVCIGRKKRGNSVNLKLELEQTEAAALVSDESSTENHMETIDDYNKALTGHDNSVVFLNNLYELHSLYQQNDSNKCCLLTAELEKKVSIQKERITTLEAEKERQDIQVEKYANELFLKEQKIKILADRARQLENSNDYRKEVARLEVVVEQGEVKLRTLEEELNGSKERHIQAVEENHVVRKELEASMKKESMMEEEIDKMNNKIKELEADLKNSKEKVAILEENKT